MTQSPHPIVGRGTWYAPAVDFTLAPQSQLDPSGDARITVHCVITQAPALEDLLQTGKLVFAVTVSIPKNPFFRLTKSAEPGRQFVKLSVPASEMVEPVLELSGYLVASCPCTIQLASTEPEFPGAYEIETGMIVAEVTYTIRDPGATTSKTPFRINHRPATTEPEVDFDASEATIWLPESLYLSLIGLGDNSVHRRSVIRTLQYAAFVEALALLRANPAAYDGLDWADWLRERLKATPCGDRLLWDCLVDQIVPTSLLKVADVLSGGLLALMVDEGEVEARLEAGDE